jgi:hypothetical protein
MMNLTLFMVEVKVPSIANTPVPSYVEQTSVLKIFVRGHKMVQLRKFHLFGKMSSYLQIMRKE